jgi:hypothetical protein
VKECLADVDQPLQSPAEQNLQTPGAQRDKINITKPLFKDFILACLKETHKIFDCEHFSIQFTCKASQTEEKDSSQQPRYIKIAIILENKKNFYPIEDIDYSIKENSSMLKTIFFYDLITK